MGSSIYVIDGKYGSVYAWTAVRMLSFQLEEWYPFEDDETLLTDARRIIEHNDERAAIAFLWQRSDHEYERFSYEEVLD